MKGIHVGIDKRLANLPAFINVLLNGVLSDKRSPDMFQGMI
jgi:hypothetical protein